MGDRHAVGTDGLKPPLASARTTRDIPVQRPPWAFWKGLLTGAAIEVPTIAAAVWVSARLGFGDPDASFMRIMRLAAVFAGIAALLTAGGVGRLAAYTSVERGRRGALFVAARAHAIGGAGLVLIAAIPHGHLPETGTAWLVPPICGVVIGALNGIVIGAVCSGTSTVGLAEVWSIARKPGETLKQLLDPEDFVRLGSALRSRTSTLFEGIFEPAPRPPEKSDKSDKLDKPDKPEKPDQPDPPIENKPDEKPEASPRKEP